MQWLLGTSELIPPQSVDLVVMSGNVTMHIIRDNWHQTLKHIALGLKPGGRLAFETRNPQARAWEHWSREQQTPDTAMGRLQERTVIEPPDQQEIVTIRSHREFLESGYTVDTVQQLQFRSNEQIIQNLNHAGLTVEHCYRSWNGEPFTGGVEQPL